MRCMMSHKKQTLVVLLAWLFLNCSAAAINVPNNSGALEEARKNSFHGTTALAWNKKYQDDDDNNNNNGKVETMVPSNDQQDEEEEVYTVNNNKATTVLLTFSLLLMFAVMGVNMRQKSFRRMENESSYRRGTYQGVSLLELPPGFHGNVSGNGVVHSYDAALEQEEAPCETLVEEGAL